MTSSRLFGALTASLLAACTNGGSATPPDASAQPDASSDPDAADPAPDASPLACTGIYCDDFESDPAGAITTGQAVGTWTAKVTGTVTLAAIDSVKPYAGTRSLHVTVPAGASAGAVLSRTVPAGLVPGNNLFGRAMVFYANAGGNAAPVGVHSTLFSALGNSIADGGNVSMNLGGGGSQMQINYHPHVGTESSVKDAPQMAAGAWHCVQWQFDGSGTPPADTAKLWVDGTVVVAVPQSKGWKFATPWSTMGIGFIHYQTLAAGVDVYLDDVVIDQAMIACP